MAVADFFSDSYVEARDKFLSAVAEAGGALLHSYRCPAEGPDGETLFTDVARIGDAGARKILLLTSATHGIEGFCGSGCHTGWLRRGHCGRDLTDDVAVIFVHAVNPHGFAHRRRVNEDNVDLNRNFVDHAKPYPVNPDYAALKDHVNPSIWTPEVLAAADAAIRAYYGNPKDDFLPKAIHGGQYVNSKGTFFGGRKPTWSNLTFRQILTTWLADATDICLIDYHTGSGPSGYLDLFVDDRAAGTRARDWFDHCTPIEAVEVKYGHAQSAVPGLLMDTVSAVFPDKRVAACLVECRTHDTRSLLTLTRHENWIHQHGDPNSAEGRRVRADFQDAFYPAKPEWRTMIFAQSNDMLRQALAGLGAA
jgi:hypothetical protein